MLSYLMILCHDVELKTYISLGQTSTETALEGKTRVAIYLSAHVSIYLYDNKLIDDILNIMISLHNTIIIIIIIIININLSYIMIKSSGVLHAETSLQCLLSSMSR